MTNISYESGFTDHDHFVDCIIGRHMDEYNNHVFDCPDYYNHFRFDRHEKDLVTYAISTTIVYAKGKVPREVK